MTGIEMVEQIGKMNITGNVTPPIWFKRITFDSGKPNSTAVLILSDIVYWYRPTEIRDEHTGLLKGFKKKFKGDMLQRNYAAFSEQYGFTKRQVKDAMDVLVKMGLVIREFRTVTAGETKLYNVMYLGLNPDRLLALTFGDLPDKYEEFVDNEDIIAPPTLERNTPSVITEDPLRYNVPGGTTERKTNTKITTKNTTKNTTKISSSSDFTDMATEDKRQPRADEEEAKELWKPKFKKITDAWNSLESVGIRKILTLNPNSRSKRIISLKARLKEYTLEQILQAIENIKHSSFLLGKGNRGWKIDFDWFICESNLPKVLEGKYLDEETIFQQDDGIDSCIDEILASRKKE